MLPTDTQERAIIDLISNVSSRYGISSFLVGGYVRDMLLNRSCKDMDVVVLGSGIDLAHHVADMLTPKPIAVPYLL